jgi:hypothetical protein
MGRLALLLVGALTAAAQVPPAALVRGVLLECDRKAAGEFSIRAADNHVLRYHFDGKTYVERQNRMIDMQGLAPGEKLEVLSDSVPDSLLRYARTVHVVEAPPPERPLSAGRYRALRRPSDELRRPSDDLFVRTGNLTYSGVVFRITADRISLHVRDGSEQSINVRKDTRYLQNGEAVEAGSLKPNMRVFVRAGKDVYGEVEAYQVIWGRILDP